MKAKKSLGQNFLKSEEVLMAIRDTVRLTTLDIILEIGPGHGALTKHLLPGAGKVIAVEKDTALAQELGQTFKKEIEQDRLEIIEGDILDFDVEILRKYKELNYKLVGNIPYYITGLILRKFLGSTYKPQAVVFLIQKEVAERIVARDGKQSILSIAVSVFGTARIGGVVEAHNFEPKPKVDSAILVIEDIKSDFFNDIDRQKFFDTLRKGFSHKRKVLLNNFEAEDRKKIEEYLNSKNLSLKIRAEELKKENWKEITSLL